MSDPSSATRIAFEGAVSSISNQDQAVDNLRKRASALAAVTISVTVFLVREAGLTNRESAWSIGGVFTTVFLGCLAYILMPHQGWNSQLDTTALLEDRYSKMADDEIYRRLAQKAHQAWVKNNAITERLQSAYRFQIALALVSIATWVILTA